MICVCMYHIKILLTRSDIALRPPPCGSRPFQFHAPAADSHRPVTEAPGKTPEPHSRRRTLRLRETASA